jgi:hypothetical protein
MVPNKVTPLTSTKGLAEIAYVCRTCGTETRRTIKED